MSVQERRLWGMIRRGLLLVARALEEETRPMYAAMRRGFLMICEAIEQECKTSG